MSKNIYHIGEESKHSTALKYRATVDHHAFSGGATRKQTVISVDRIRTPPIHMHISNSQSKVNQHRHERHAGVQRPRENIVIPLPPSFPVPEDEVVKDRADQNPRVVINRRGRRHVGGGAEEDGEVDERNPGLVGEISVEDVDEEWAEEAAEEKPVESWVVSLWAEDPFWAD